MDIELNLNKEHANKSPIINGQEVVFIYPGKAETVYVVGDYNNWEPVDSMKKIGEGDLWYLKKNFPENSRFDYKLIVDGNWMTDPLNKNVTPGGAGDNSTLIMPGYQSEYEKIINRDVPRGTVIRDQKFYSSRLNIEMRYHLYLPFEYEKGSSHQILYALDGSDYLNFGKINLVLDYMIHQGEIPKVVAVLVDPHERTKEYTLYEPYFDYVTKELMPFMEGTHMSSENGFDRAIIGVSWGGLTAIYLAVNSPGSFTRVLSQSGSFWPKDWEIFHIINKAVTPPINFCIQTGTIEDTEEMNNALANLLTAKGYRVDYMKYAESHSWGNWRGHLNEGLKKLYPEIN